MEYDEFPAMNTTIQVAAEGCLDDLGQAFQQVRLFIAECEARFSRFREDSELCQLNRSAGAWFQASTGLFELVQISLDMYRLTGGLFDPSILKSLQLAGYDRSMEVIASPGYQPDAVITERPLKIITPFDASLLDQVRLDFNNEAIYLPPGVQIDLGGIAKGWIAEEAVRLLSKFTPASAVSAGGDMAFQGIPAGEPAWQVSLEDPRDEQNVLAVLQIRSGALATSSITRRSWIKDGQARHHIIDPRTGFSAKTEWLSVCAGAPNAAVAEAFAKAILIGGSDAAVQLSGRIPGSWFIAVLPDGSLVGTQNYKEIIYGSI